MNERILLKMNKKNKQINKIREKYCATDAEKLHSQI